MNWEAIGAVAETLAAIAVVISLVYLTIQVRQTKAQLQAQSEDAIATRAFDAFAPIYEGDNAKIYYKGLHDPESLTEYEVFVFRLLMDRQRGAFSAIVRRKITGLIEPELAERFLDGYRYQFTQTAGGKFWLDQARHVISKAELRELSISDRPS